ncbi:MAG: phosphatidate cytidylyltransferase [Candidatus Angelobacter sp.]
MKRVLTAAVLVPVVLLIVFKAPLWLFALVVGALIVLALREYLGMVEAAGIKPFRWLTYIASVLPILCFLYSMWREQLFYPWLRSLNWGMLVPLIAIIFGIPLVFRKDLRGGLASVAASAFGALYVGVSLSLLVKLQSDFVITLFLFLLFSVWGGDIAAYYVGKNIGKHKLAPIVSPNKSWEGAIASVFASVALAFLILHFHPQLIDFILRIEGANRDERTIFTRYLTPIRLTHIICLGILTNVAAQFGDLFESALKRGAGVKDSGTIIPGHGGLLDRIDALLFAIPVVWYYATQTGLLMKIND